jgi:hypothetical protein
MCRCQPALMPTMQIEHRQHLMQLQRGSCAHLVVYLEVGRADQELGVRRGVVLDRSKDVLNSAANDAAAWRSSRRV